MTPDVFESGPIDLDEPTMELEDLLFHGLFPRIPDQNLEPTPWLDGYVRTYIERDVRQLANIGNLDTFNRFVALCAGRSGQLLNLSGLASDTGVSQPTAQRWLSILQASYIVFPDQDQGGTHVNVSGAAVTKAAPNRENAVRLLTFMTGEEAQEIYASKNFEYPVKPGVPWSERVRSWGEFKADPIALDRIAGLRKRASELVDEVRFNDGPGS